MSVQAFQLKQPKLWRAGCTIDKDGKEEPFYFGCCQCEKEDIPIAGFVGHGTAWEEISLIVKKSEASYGTRERIYPALYCADCWPSIVGSVS